MIELSQNGVAKVTVGGRDFVFIRPTLVYLRKYHPVEVYFNGLAVESFNKIFEDDSAFKEYSRMWNKMCRIAFVKNPLTDLLWRIRLPKNLRLDVLDVEDMIGVSRSFFDFVGGRTTVPNASSQNIPSSEKGEDTSPIPQENIS